MSTPRHREAVDRSTTEKAARKPAAASHRGPLFAPSASKRRTERRMRGAAIEARAAMLKEICTFIRGLSAGMSPLHVAREIERHFALPVLP